MTEKISPELLQQELDQFIGTEHYYKVGFSVLLTDGAMHLAQKAECFWLIDIIDSYQSLMRSKDVSFQVWNVDRNTKTVTCEDGNYNPVLSQKLDFMEFPFEKFSLWAQFYTEKYTVIYLPSEH